MLKRRSKGISNGLNLYLIYRTITSNKIATIAFSQLTAELNAPLTRQVSMMVGGVSSARKRRPTDRWRAT
jgi:hypothetical protein